MNILKTALAAGLFAVVGSIASAATFNVTSTVGDTGITGSIDITLAADQTGVPAGQYLFDITVTNNDDAAYGQSTISAFFLLSDPASTFVSTTSTRYEGASDTMLEPFTTVFNFCLEADSNGNCNGGNANDGLGEGESETFTLLVSAASQPVFTQAAIRWQQTDGNEGSAKGESECEFDPCFPVTDVPLPASLPLLLAGLGVTGYVARRKQKAA